MELTREVSRLLAHQSGVIARRQAHAGGLAKHDIDRLLRRRDWVRAEPGVYINHTGIPTWLQRAWIGVLYYWPAALAGASAMRANAGPGWRPHRDDGPVSIAVASDRHVSARDGYRIRYLADYDTQVHANTHPPRMRLEEACLDLVAGMASKLDRIQLLAVSCQSRLTTPARLAAALEGRARMPDRRWVVDVLRDIAEGTCSVLEHGYLTLVERPHALPRGTRQKAEHGSRGRIYRDVA